MEEHPLYLPLRCLRYAAAGMGISLLWAISIIGAPGFLRYILRLKLTIKVLIHWMETGLAILGLCFYFKDYGIVGGLLRPGFLVGITGAALVLWLGAYYVEGYSVFGLSGLHVCYLMNGDQTMELGSLMAMAGAAFISWSLGRRRRRR